MSDTEELLRPALTPNHSVLSKLQRFSWTFRKWWWILLITTGLGVSWETWNDAKKAPSYRSDARMMVSGKIALPESAPYSEEGITFYGTQSRLMESAPVRQAAAARVESTLPDLRASAVHVSVTQERGTSFFILTAIGEEPHYTQAFLNACMEEYIRLKRGFIDKANDEILISLTENLLKVERDLEAGQLELIEFTPIP